MRGGKCDSFDPFAFVLRSGGDDIDINDDESIIYKCIVSYKDIKCKQNI